MNNNYYNKKLKLYARELRNCSVSKAEKRLWKSVLSRGKTGAKFKRQRPISRFIVDFFSQEIGLIIEIDGSSHFSKPEYDYIRQKELERMGYVFLRFTEGNVMQDTSGVGEVIHHAVHCLKEEKDS